MKGCDYTAQQHGGAHGDPACRGRGAREAAGARRVLCGQPVCPGVGIADGRWLAPKKRNTDLAKRLRASVSALVQQRGHRYVTLSHVRAHARTPGNEAADQLAKSAARDDGEAKDPMRALALASNTHRQVRDNQTSEQRGFGAPGRRFGDA